MDETGVSYGSAPLVRKRPRVVLTGEGIDDIVDAKGTLPNNEDIGLVVREARKGQSTSANSIPVVVASDQTVGRSNVIVFQQIIGLSETQLLDKSISLSVTIKSMDSNDGVVYLGIFGVTNSNGFELSAGESISISIDNTNRLYAIASSINQKLCIIGI
jgi:hypothetical protein